VNLKETKISKQALEFYKTGDFQSAINLLYQNILKNNNNFQEIILLGVCYFKIHDYKKVIDTLKDIIIKYPKESSKQSFLYIMISYIKNNDLEQAYNIFIQAKINNKLDVRMAESILKLFIDSDNLNELKFVYEVYPFWSKETKKVKQKYEFNYVKYLEKLEVAKTEIEIEIPKEILQEIEILVPTYNRKDEIIGFIEAIRKQNKQVSIRIVDNDSPDNTFLELQKIVENDKNLFVVKNDKNMGYSYSMLRLLEETKGKYIVFSSDEDPIIIQNLVESIEFMKKNKSSFLSPVFIAKNRIYRSKSFIEEIQPKDFGQTAFYTSGIIFETKKIQSYISLIKEHSFKTNQIYPQLIFAISMLAKDKGYWYDKPIAFRKFVKKTNVNEDIDGDEMFNGVIERWRQFKQFIDFIDDLEKSISKTEEDFNFIYNIDYKKNLFEMKEELFKTVIFSIKNGAKREYPKYAEYFN
jgi:tetratricopeptide (TPR) repeat protein